MRYALLGLVLFASCCSTQVYDEWRWEEVDARTLMWDIPVTFPSWLEKEDEEKVLLTIDMYWQLIMEVIPEASQIDMTTYTIHIHDNIGAFWVPSARCWCKGWQCGHHIQIAWGWKMENGIPHGIAVHDPFDALAHEILHILVDMVYGFEDPGHMFFPLYDAQLQMISAMAPDLKLSELSIVKAKLYRYIPSSLDGPRW